MSLRTRPLVALSGREDVAAPISEFLVCLSSYVDLAAFDPSLAGQFSGHVAAAPEWLRAGPTGLPSALWVADVGAAERVQGYEEVRVVLAMTAEAAHRAGPKGLVLPAVAVPLSRARLVLPIVRTRLRRARGLPAAAVAVVDDEQATWCGAPCPYDLVDTALACAGAVVARGTMLLRAMAWGAPIVTDEVSRRAVGATNERELLVDEVDPIATALAISDAEPRAAAFSWRARRFYEERFDMQTAAFRVAKMIGGVPTGHGRIRRCSEELAAPAGSDALERASALIAPIVA
jgi:hypothetical protein